MKNTAIEYTLGGVLRLFMDRYVAGEESATHVTTMSGKRGPICEILELKKPSLFGEKYLTVFVSKKVDWFHEYGRDYSDSTQKDGMLVRREIAERAGTVRGPSLIAIYVQKDEWFYGMSGKFFWNYCKAYGRIKDSPYEKAVVDCASPRLMWKELFSDNKWKIAMST